MAPLNAIPTSPTIRTMIVALVGFALLMPVLAGAAIDPDRIKDDQTGWFYLSNVTEAQITQLIIDENARLIDIEIYSTSPLRFTAAFVRNTGVYASGWWWYFGLSFADIAVRLDANNGRLIDIERYVDGFGLERWAVVMVPNTGAQQKGWWYYAGINTAQISNFASTLNARLIDIESYDTATGRQYAVIMISNTGEDFTQWGWYFNVDPATLQNFMTTNGYRLLEFEVRDPQAPRFDAVMIRNSYQPPQTWWWYYNVPFDQLGDLAAQAGSRIVDIDTYLLGGNRSYNVVMLNNSSALTVEIASILEWGSDGDTGCYLREIEGPTQASLQPDFRFEPASTIKAVHHLHTMRQVMAGNIQLSDPITYSENYNNSCPIGGNPMTTQSLQEVLRRMMVNSDNAAAKAISDRYGFNAITSTAQLVAGMTSTTVNHTLGCGTAAIANPNTLTLRDAGTLFERVETLQVLSQPMRDRYYALMQNQDTPSPWWFTNNLEATVNEEAAALGIPDAASSFWANVKTAWKPGGYTLNFDGTNHEYISVAGIVSLPTCRTWPDVAYRDYVFGVFVHDGSNNADTFSRVSDAARELFRDAIAQALITCPSAVDDALPVARGMMLEPNFPNPFNPSTQLVFNLDRPEHVTLTVYDSAGRLVAVVDEGQRVAGRHAVTWEGRDETGRLAPAGVYFARLQVGDRKESLKMALIK